MEEADILGDRIGIVARGRLRALGNSIRLKQKFGTGYQVLVSLLDSRTAAAVAAGGGKHTPGVRQRRRSGSKPAVGSAAAAAAGGSSDGSSGMQSPRGGVGSSQQQWPELSPRNVVVGQVVSQGGPLQIPASIAEDPSTPSSSSSPAAASSSSSGSSGRRSRETPPGSPRGDYNSHSSSGGSNSSTAAGPRGAVRALFAAHLDGLVPSEENRRSLQFLVPRHQQQQLVGLLQQLEAAMAAGSNGGSSGSSLAAAAEVIGEDGVRALQRGVADVQLSLTSLEEVFLSIAKQVSCSTTVCWCNRGGGGLGRGDVC
jgi:hypothetical protein